MLGVSVSLRSPGDRPDIDALNSGAAQHASELDDGLAGRDHVVDDCDMPCLGYLGNPEGPADVAMALSAFQSHLRDGRPRPFTASRIDRKAPGSRGHPCYLQSLIVAALPQSRSVQWHGNNALWPRCGLLDERAQQAAAEEAGDVHPVTELRAGDEGRQWIFVTERREGRVEGRGTALAASAEGHIDRIWGQRQGTSPARPVIVRKVGKTARAQIETGLSWGAAEGAGRGEEPFEQARNPGS